MKENVKNGNVSTRESVQKLSNIQGYKISEWMYMAYLLSAYFERHALLYC